MQKAEQAATQQAKRENPAPAPQQLQHLTIGVTDFGSAADNLGGDGPEILPVRAFDDENRGQERLAGNGQGYINLIGSMNFTAADERVEIGIRSQSEGGGAHQHMCVCEANAVGASNFNSRFDALDVYFERLRKGGRTADSQAITEPALGEIESAASHE